MKNLVLLISLALIGCGFKPLYDDDSNITELASIKIETSANGSAPEKFTIKLKHFLEDALGTSEDIADITKNLNVVVTKSTASYETQNNTENRMRITLNITFTLKDLVTNKVLYEDKMIAIDSFKVADSTYSALLTEEETTIKMIKEISNEIKLRILRKLWV